MRKVTILLVGLFLLASVGKVMALAPPCQNMWWFDSSNNFCSQKSFCGSYMYQDLRTYKTLAECRSSLGVRDQILTEALCGGVTMTGNKTVTITNSIRSTRNVWEMVEDTKTKEKVLISWNDGIDINTVKLTDANMYFGGIRRGGGFVEKMSVIADGRRYVVKAYTAPSTAGIPIFKEENLLASSSFSFNCPVIPTNTPKTNCSMKKCGDANCDGKIDAKDFLVWMRERTRTEKTADFNGDGKVDMKDYEIIKKGTTKGCGVVTPTLKPTVIPKCVQSCPNTNQKSLLQSCSPPDSDGTSKDSLCNAVGRMESCGGKNYCCPAVGSAWTTDMSKCAPPTPVPCVQSCPNTNQKSLLQSCSPPDSDGTSKDSLCNAVGRIESCGGKNYCCPAVGSAWTTDMTKCAPPTPVPCVQSCPNTNQKSLLQSCSPPDSDGTSKDSLCNAVGRIESCGGKNYCCPAVGSAWTTDMSKCGMPTPVPCVQSCPNTNQKSLLQSCSPPDSDGTSKDSLCNAVGRIESCGGKNYCCPAVGSAWTTDMSKCGMPTPSSSDSCNKYGDADGDGKATMKDFSIWKFEYSTGKTNRADFDCNKVVDTSDYQIWKNAFLSSRSLVVKQDN